MLAHLKSASGGRSFDSADASIGHAAVRGAIIGYFAVLALVGTLVFTTAGVGLGTALAVGAYVGLWGGPGWGGMVAAQMHADRIEAAERSATRRAAEEAHRPDGVPACPGPSSYNGLESWESAQELDVHVGGAQLGGQSVPSARSRLPGSE